MFTLLSDESVSPTSRRDALYISLTIHVCGLLALTWLSLFRDQGMPLRLIAVAAGSQELVRDPRPLRVPVPAARPPLEIQSHRSNARPRTEAPVRQTPQTPQTDDETPVEYTPTEVPSGLLALIDAGTGALPGLGPSDGGVRTVPLPLLPLGEASPPPPPEPPPGEPEVKPPPVIGGRVEQPVLVKQTTPEYPAMAKTARVEGVVILEGTVSVEGKVENLQVVSGHPMLVDAAVKAVRKWKYRPGKLNGQLIACPLTVQVRFALRYSG